KKGGARPVGRLVLKGQSRRPARAVLAGRLQRFDDEVATWAARTLRTTRWAARPRRCPAGQPHVRGAAERPGTPGKRSGTGGSRSGRPANGAAAGWASRRAGSPTSGSPTPAPRRRRAWTLWSSLARKG